jgi:DedD protein
VPAKPISRMASEVPDNTQLKRRARRRLIGAIALVLLAVIFLPMIFDAEKKPLDQDISIQIPSQGDYVSHAPPVLTATPGTEPKAAPAPQSEAPAAAAPPPEAAKAEAASKADAKPDLMPDAKPAQEAPVEGKTDAQKTRELADAKRAQALLNGEAAAPKLEKPAEKAGDGGFAVQIGAFATEEKVRDARDKLSAAGLKSYVEKVVTKEGGVTRVRAGPYASKDAAQAALGKISSLGFGNAKVVSR